MACLHFSAVLFAFLINGANAKPEIVDPSEPSDALLTFYYMINGVFTNFNQLATETYFGDKITVDDNVAVFHPVDIPALSPALTMYFEEILYNKVRRMHVLVFTEDEEGVIHARPLNFTDPSKYEPHSFKPALLSEFKAEDFDVSPEVCDLTIMRVEENVFVGTWPDCTHLQGTETPPMYGMVSTCNVISFVNTHPGSPEKVTRVPNVVYNVLRFEDKPDVCE